MHLSPPERSRAVRRSASRLCRALGWAPLHEVSLPNGRRADLLALRPDGCFVCVEVKSCEADFCADRKWPEYRAFCDALFFAVDADFPRALLPPDVGVIVAGDDGEAALLREAPAYRLPPARRRALMQRFAMLAACRLEQMLNPLANEPWRCE